MRILNRAAVAAALSHADCIAALDPAMRAVSADRAILPLRQFISIPGTSGKFTLMPGYVADPRTFGFKVVAKYPRAADSPYGSHVGAVMIFDADLGIPVAIMDGAELTAIRTAAASALATRELAREDSRTLAILGTGKQALHHIHAIAAVRPIRDVRVWGRDAERAQAFVAGLDLPADVTLSARTNVQDTLDGADIVCTTTAATTPILAGADLAAGMHVNLVGAAVAAAAEADSEVVTRSRFFVDYRESAMAQAGELLDAIGKGVIDKTHIVGEIGEVLLGQVAGREKTNEITTYKSLGVAAQDLAAGTAATHAAERRDIGTTIDWH